MSCPRCVRVPGSLTVCEDCRRVAVERAVTAHKANRRLYRSIVDAEAAALLAEQPQTFSKRAATIPVPREVLERVREALRMVVSRKGGSFGALSECQDPCADALADLDRLLGKTL